MAFIKRKGSVKPAEVAKDFSDIAGAAELLSFAEKRGINVEPLDVAELSKALGIKMSFEPMKGEDSGSLKKVKKTGEWIMRINSLHHPNRQRFTIAHELGHFIKHSMRCDEFSDAAFFRNGETNPMEAEANGFAAELLMPAESFRRYIERESSEVDKIANHFQVSALAVRIRAKQLGYQGHNL